MMSVPYTQGKANIATATDADGHTAAGVTPSPGCTAAATSNENTRIGDLSTRTHGMGNDRRK